MKVFSIFNPKKPVEQLDVMIENPIPFERAYKNRKVVSAKGFKIPVVSIPDLIKLKKIAGRERDKVDIRALQEIRSIQNAYKKKKKKAIRNGAGIATLL